LVLLTGGESERVIAKANIEILRKAYNMMSSSSPPLHFQYIAGAYYEATPVAVQAILNANMATVFAVLIWLAMDQIYDDKIRASGMCYGVISGLAAISPSAGAGRDDLPYLSCTLDCMIALTSFSGTCLSTVF